MEMVGRRDRRLIFLNGYRVGRNQRYSVGSITAYCQQYRILQRAGHANPNPRELFIDDLITLIKDWSAAGCEILLCLDANEESDQLSLEQGLGRLISTTGLIDLHRFRFSGEPTPATHQRGSKTIDICLGTKLFAQALVKAWYLPFGLPITLTGDHRTVGLEFDHHILFGNKLPPVAPLQSRGVYSNAYPIVRRFNDNVAKACSNSNLYQRVEALCRTTQFTAFHHQMLEQIDKELTKILVSEDKACRKIGDYPWSPKLHQAFLHHRYWSLQLTSRRTKKDLSVALQQILNQLTEPLYDGPSIAANLRQARKNLRETRRNAQQLRQEYLNSLLDQANQTSNQQRNKLILHLK